MAIITPRKHPGISPTVPLSLKRNTHLVFWEGHSPDRSELWDGLDSEDRKIHRLETLKEVCAKVSNTPCAAAFISSSCAENANDVFDIIRESSLYPEITLVVVMDHGQNAFDHIALMQAGADDMICSSTPCQVIQQRVRRYESLFHQFQEMRVLNEKLQSANQQLEEYVYIVSHDLKAPLRGLSSLSEFIEQELGPDITREVSELLQMMKSRTERMQQMIDGILHYCRMANSFDETTEVDVKLLINNIIDLICPPGNVRISYPDRMPVLRTEKIKIHEVFQNLIMNGIKHNDKQDIRIDISYRELGDTIEFSVQDNGKGIKPEFQEKVFGFFQTLVPKDRSEGTGLGLTIVKKIVEMQDGKITLESDFGKGSVFRFTWKK